MSSIKQPAVHGFFYPADPTVLKKTVLEFLSVPLRPQEAAWPPPKAIIAPHAGYIYSGAVAGSIYRFLKPLKSQIKKVLLLGPAHRVGFKGIAGIGVEYFATPLGQIAVDKLGMEKALAFDFVHALEIPYKQEHCLEVQLPFLQTLFDDFSILPFLVSDATPEQVASVIECLWGSEETLIVISSDLSHYKDYETANQLDQKTMEAILNLQSSAIGYEQACGRLPIQGLLQVAQKKGLKPKLVDLRNSGDTAGDKSRVVGYPAVYFGESV